jgi:hypothetical protein
LPSGSVTIAIVTPGRNSVTGTVGANALRRELRNQSADIRHRDCEIAIPYPPIGPPGAVSTPD